MKILAFSDTHTYHRLCEEFILEHQPDMIIHAGDAAHGKLSNEADLREFMGWYNGLDVRYKIYVPGNHDISIERGYIKPEEYPNIITLIDTFTIIESIKIWGSPRTPSFGMGWAYNVARHKIQKYWEQLTEDIDILVTHGPPKGILDHTMTGYGGNEMHSVGCKALLTHVKRIEPKYHIVGHIHDEKGIYNHGTKTINGLDTTFVNASIVDLQTNFKNLPIILTLD